MRINTVYYGKEALISFRRNVVQNFAAVTTVGLCLVVIGAMMLIGYLGRQLISKVEQQVEIEVFLADTAPTKEVDAFGETILSWPQVKKVVYVSKAEALRRFRKEFRDQPDVLENLGPDNPLPASYVIGLKNPRTVASVVDKIKGIPNLDNLVADANDDIKWGQNVVEKLFKVTSTVSMVFGGFAVLLVFVALVLITNTIRLAIFARRKEIAIMKLVGASSWFVRWPFLLEGMLQGLLGSVIAVAILTLIYRYLTGLASSGDLLRYVSPTVDAGELFRIGVTLAFSGIAIGAGGSAIALRRFLKV